MRRLLLNLAAAALAVGFAGEALADSITLGLDTPLAGKPAASGAPTITFDDGGGTGSVTVTFDLTGLSGSEFVSKWFFNSAIDPTSFTFTYSSGAVAESISTIFNSTSDWKADGTGGFHDIKFKYSTSEGYRFEAGTTSVYVITGTGITAQTFNVFGLANSGDPLYKAVAHVQGISADPGSTWMADDGPNPVPEPGTFLLLALGAGAFGASKRGRIALKG